MKILQWIANSFNERRYREDVERYYRTEYSREWRQCRELYPTSTNSQIVNSCFKGRFGR